MEIDIGTRHLVSGGRRNLRGSGVSGIVLLLI